jgi:zinc and cadmium transporter
MSGTFLSPEIYLFIACVVVLGASLAGGWLPSLLRLNHSRLQMAVSLVSGLMLGLAMLHLLPHSAEELGSTGKASAWLMAGFLVMFLLQRFLPFHHHDVGENQPHADCGHDHAHSEAYASHLDWFGVALGLSLHSIFDGLALAAAIASLTHGHAESIALGTTLAILLHKPFGAMAITTLITASRASSRALHAVNFLFSLVTPVAAVLFYFGGSQLIESHPAWLGVALAFSAGTFLCIACADLLPELQFHSHDRQKLSVALLAGLGIAILIGRFGHVDHAHGAEPPSHEEAPLLEDHTGHDHH